jgi:hypothetical protein
MLVGRAVSARGPRAHFSERRGTSDLSKRCRLKSRFSVNIRWAICEVGGGGPSSCVIC